MFYLIVIGIVGVWSIFYLYIQKKFRYWKSRGVYSPKPKFPLGNFNGLGVTQHTAEITSKIYNDVKHKAPFAGVFLFIHPSILVADLELIKNIMVSDFDYFRNRAIYYNAKDDPLSAHLFSLEDQKWKSLRANLTPTFTTGKMKMMFEILLSTATEMINHITTLAADDKEFDLKDIVSRYSTDVIGSCAFGIECNSLINSEAEFRVFGREVFNPSRWEQLRLFFGNAFPELARKMRICVIRKEISEFFIRVVNETITSRKLTNYKRNDFMQLLLDIQKNNKNFTDLDIAAQAFLFFLAGFETSGATMSFALYELALNPKIQNKLRHEINGIISKHNNVITYEATNELPYLDQVINETLRKYPAVDTLVRKVERDYRVAGTNCVLEKDTSVFIPVFAIQNDPEIYPDPEKFDPDRFIGEIAAKRHPFAFLPFGDGPRVCIGLRFGMMQTRLGIITILRNFEVIPCPNTPQKISFQKRPFTLVSERKIFVKVKDVILNANR